MKQINFHNLEIIYIEKKGLKNLSLSLKKVQHEVKIVLKTPPKTSTVFIEELLIKKEKWLLKKIALLQQKITLFLVQKPQKEEYETSLTQRVEYFAKQMQVEYKKIVFKNLKSRWGSCSSDGVITLNMQLAKVEKELQDYVIVHELAHLVHMNHSKAFHSYVEYYLPDAKILRKQLHNKYIIN